MADKYSDGKWDYPKSAYTVPQLLAAVPAAMAEYARAEAKKNNRDVVKGECHLRYRTPTGTIVLKGIERGLGRLNQVKGPSSDQKARARAELLNQRSKARKALGKLRSTF